MNDNEKEILNFEASKKAMSKFSDDEKALLMMDMTQNLFEAHKMRYECEQKIEKLQAENAKLRKCVEFYSNTDNWLEEKDRNNLYTIIKKDASDDYCDSLRFGGKRARQVLKELEEK